MKNLFLILCICFATFQTSIAQNEAKQESIQKIFNYLSENKLFNGVAIVVDDGNVIYNKAFGNSNEEWNIPNGNDSRFEIGSVTKQFTAMLIMQLVAENKIETSDSIGQYLPEIIGKFGRITIHQLLTHTSGLPTHFSVFPDYLTKHVKIPYTFNERVGQIKDQNYVFEPDSSWAYNGFGYTILGKIVEIISGKSLEYNYDQRIFKPIGMLNTGCFFDTKLVINRAYGYQRNWDNSLMPPEFFAATKGTLGGGGIYSTVPDLLKWHNALQGNALLSKKYMNIYMTHHYKFSDNDGYTYGNFFEIYEVNKSKTLNVYFHGGSLPGTSSMLLRIPETNQCIIILHNAGMSTEGFLQEIAFEILNVLYEKEHNIPKLNIFYPLIYTAAFYSDIENLKKQYFYLKKNMPDAYIFGPEQLSIVTMLLSQYNMDENVESILKFNIEEYPENYEVYLDLGNYYIKIKKLDLAKEYFNKALVLSKDNEEIINLLNEIKENK